MVENKGLLEASMGILGMALEHRSRRACVKLSRLF